MSWLFSMFRKYPSVYREAESQETTRRPMLKLCVEDAGVGWGESGGVSQVSFTWIQIPTWILPSHQTIVKGERKTDTIYILSTFALWE